MQNDCSRRNWTGVVDSSPLSFGHLPVGEKRKEKNIEDLKRDYMEKLKDIKIVLLVLLVVLVLVIVSSTGKNRFKQDAREAIEALESNNFQVSTKELKGNENQYLIVDLTESGSALFENSVKIPFKKLLEESTLQKLKETENKILLVSDDNLVAVKAWVILNQLEFINVFVLSNEENTEVLKYEFKPDTVTRLEKVSE